MAREEEIVVKASRAGWDMNSGLHNGLALFKNFHQGGVNSGFDHSQYNERIIQVLRRMDAKYPDMTDQQAAEFLTNYVAILKNMFENTPGAVYK